jgi:hypothetical protein
MFNPFINTNIHRQNRAIGSRKSPASDMDPKERCLYM